MAREKEGGEGGKAPETTNGGSASCLVEAEPSERGKTSQGFARQRILRRLHEERGSTPLTRLKTMAEMDSTIVDLEKLLKPCGNPVCKIKFGPSQRRFCREQCKTDRETLKRASVLLSKVDIVTAFEILRELRKEIN